MTAAIVNGQTYEWSSASIGGVTLPPGSVRAIAYESEADPSKLPTRKTTGTYRAEVAFAMTGKAFREFRDALDRAFPPRPVTFLAGPRDRGRAVRRGDARAMVRRVRHTLDSLGAVNPRVELNPDVWLARPKGAPRVRR
jgi:hypothetical protein